MKLIYINKLFILIFFFVFSTMPSSSIYAQAGITLEGKVLNSVTSRSPDFATVIIVEAELKARTGEDGSYRVLISEAGEYTVIVRSAGLRTLKTKINISSNMKRNFYLEPLRIRGGGVTITDERDIQKASRNTMKRQDLKDVPGTFGDSLNALTALPGVIRTSGFLGPLVIRGAYSRLNNYFIDGMPLYIPIHYGGLHSVINNNLISEIDLYSSSFPPQFGSANAAVINMNTIDEVKEFGGYTDLSLLSANVFLQVPIKKGMSNESVKNVKRDNAGYFIASGRYGYLGLIMPMMINDDQIEITPEYWDYQAKLKYFLNGNHSITLLFAGAKDYMKQVKKKESSPEEDPLFEKFEMKFDQKFNNQGLYYTYHPSKKFKNTLMAFSALQESYQYMNFPDETVQDFAKNLGIKSRPYIFGFKNLTIFEYWEDHAEIRTGFEYTIYNFKVDGTTIIPRGPIDFIDLSNEDQWLKYNIDDKIVNRVVGGYAENKFTFGGLEFLPGVRIDHLDRNGETVIDPRGMISYEFSTGTTIYSAGGKYSYFFQTNPELFDTNPDVCKIDKLMSEKALHRAVGIEQKIDLFTVKVEGFYNNYWDLGEAYPHTEPDGTYLAGLSTGKIKSYGAEIMLQKDRRENSDGLFGWLSYTYTRSKYKSGLPTEAGYAGFPENVGFDEYGDTWINFPFEQRHSLKLISGYRLGNHTISGKFQFYSSFPYTPIVGSSEDTQFASDHPGEVRYIPDYGYRNSKYFDPIHTLDIRYSYKMNFSWGYISFYIEVINVYNYVPENDQKFDFRKPYGPDNPRIVKPEDGMFLGIMPNFGIEAKF